MSRGTRLLPLAATLWFVVGAREQCLPGPFQYESAPPCGEDGACEAGFFCDSGFCVAGGGGPVGPIGPGSACVDDPDCVDLGDDFRCLSGFCQPVGQRGCQLARPDDPTCFDDESCVPTGRFNGSANFLDQEGRCQRVAADAGDVDSPCDPDERAESPCRHGLVCLPLADGVGFCVAGCDEGGGNGGTCDVGRTCSAPFLDAPGGRGLCLPACDLTAPVCPDLGAGQLVCTRSNFGAGCPPDGGACVPAGCAPDGDCRAGLCDDGDCAAGEFCIDSVVPNCRVDGPVQTIASCRPPGGEFEPCLLQEPTSCADGFACSPFGNGGNGEARCVQQDGPGIDDGAPCSSPNGGSGANVCRPGSFCGGDGPLGVCQRFCANDDDCDGDDSCQNANLGRVFPDLADVTVCAAGCADDGDCVSGLFCDVDGGLCSDPGFCLTREVGNACGPDGDCFGGDVCGGDGLCAPPGQQCLATPCILTDPGSCPAGQTCSPFSDPPSCVDTIPSPVFDGGPCTAGALPSECESGAFCIAGACARFCAADRDCDGDEECVRGNVGPANDPADFSLAELTVCARPCSAGAPCTLPLVCDVDGGGPCAGDGFCLPPERGGPSCSTDVECGALWCDLLDGRCKPAADVCTF